MKKFILFFSILITAICVCACSSDDDSDSFESNLPIGLTDEAITDFFNSELPELHHSYDRYRNTESFFYEIIDSVTSDGMAIKENMVYVINCQQELADVYQGKRELPAIDFDKYTLIIGQQIMPGLGFYVVKKELLTGDNGLILTLYARNDNEIISCALQNLYFWRIYPKLSQNTISVNVIEEYTRYRGV